MAEEKKENVEELKKEIERLKKEMEELKKEVEKEEEHKMDKEKVVEVLDSTENLIKKAFSLVEGAIIGAIEGAKKNIK